MSAEPAQLGEVEAELAKQSHLLSALGTIRATLEKRVAIALRPAPDQTCVAPIDIDDQSESVLLSMIKGNNQLLLWHCGQLEGVISRLQL